MALKEAAGKLAYGTLFAAVAPLALWGWARAVDPRVPLAVYPAPWLGWALAAAGAALLAAGMWALWARGGGLPMNAFPPPRLVATGLYGWLPHPIYTGFSLACLGLSVALRSPGGFWIVTPAVILGCAALVLGYERPDLRRRFGAVASRVALLPPEDGGRPSLKDRLRFYQNAALPWLALYGYTATLGAAPGAVAWKLPGEDALAVLEWTWPVYASTYLVVAIAPWWCADNRELRRLNIAAWVAMLIAFPFYWILPSLAPRRPVEAEALFGGWLRGERDAYPPTAAFPSFHVAWQVIIAPVVRPRWSGWALALAVAVSCVTTGMHYVADLFAGALLGWMALRHASVWELLRGGAERLANSWRAWRFGPVRVISHGVYAAVAAAVTVAIAGAALGPARVAEVWIPAACGLAGAALWAQWIEGSPRLLRPFGFYGGMLGVALAGAAFEQRWLVWGAYCLAAPWMQAAGRLRCLVQGCCHGRAAAEGIGIRYRDPRSRVCAIAGLAGVPVHATPLYSLLWNVLCGGILGRLWASGAPLEFVCGGYAMLNGLGRFAEEAYRGEPQTRVIAGLRLYQWMALGSVLLGAALTAGGRAEAAPALAWHAGAGWAAVAIGLAAGFALGVDWPGGKARFSRLTQ